MLDFRIYTFLAVCETMNFTKAAAELHITQPAVSQHIHFLEDYYKGKLFSYEGKKLQFTAAGRLLYDAVNAMVHDEKILKDKMAETHQEKKQIRFGVTLTIGDYVIGTCVAGYVKKHADARIHMRVENTHELLSKLKSREIDFAIVEGHLQKNEFSCRTFSKEKYIAVCGSDYEFQKKIHRVEDLLGEKLVIREAGSGTREILERSLESRNLRLKDFASITEIGSIHVIKQMVAAKLGITFLYEAAVEEELSCGILQKIPLADFNLNHDFSFVWTKNSIFEQDYLCILQEMQQALV